MKYFSTYESHYGNNSKLGDALIKGQNDSLRNEGLGVPIMEGKLQRAKNMYGDRYEKCFPKPLHGTTER